MVSETQIDESFPINRFTMQGYCDRNAEGSGIIT